MVRAFMAIILVAFFATACNTMSGAGKDIERGGEKSQGAAERNKKSVMNGACGSGVSATLARKRHRFADACAACRPPQSRMSCQVDPGCHHLSSRSSRCFSALAQ
jgi:predicted small secreted protein